jgi:putative ATPase
VGPNGSLTQQIAKELSLPSFYGDRTGKTTLAQIIAGIKTPFYILSAINSGVKDIREVIESKKQSGGLFTTKNPILFIDEIHRFSKSQQDSLLAAVEKGWITLIEPQPKIPALKSCLIIRCQVYVLNAFTKEDLESLLQRALKQILLASKNIELKQKRYCDFLVVMDASY